MRPNQRRVERMKKEATVGDVWGLWIFIYGLCGLFLYLVLT